MLHAQGNVLQHIDYIARAQQCDVLFITFEPSSEWYSSDNDYSWLDYPYIEDVPEGGEDKCNVRNRIIAFLQANSIPFEECFYPDANYEVQPYEGALYIDVPNDKGNKHYQLVTGYMEYDDGTCKQLPAILYLYTLKQAIKNDRNGD